MFMQLFLFAFSMALFEKRDYIALLDVIKFLIQIFQHIFER